MVDFVTDTFRGMAHGALPMLVAASLSQTCIAAESEAVDEQPRLVSDFPTGEDNPRNGEGDFVRLNDGRILFAYTKFSGKSMKDNAPATIAARFSSDEGESWSEDRELVAREGKMNVMGVSLLRLDPKRIAIFYSRKNSNQDCSPWMRVTDDDFQTLSEPKRLLGKDNIDYFVCNNARATRLKSGRIILPLARHSKTVDGEFSAFGRLFCLYSDDNGETWTKGEEYVVTDADGERVYIQEPGIVELTDGRLYLYARTNRGRQWQAFSKDKGQTWGDFAPSPIIGPRGPATIERLKSGDLLLVWNDHEGREYLMKRGPKWLIGMRAPLNTAISRDEGKTWTNRRTVEADEKGFFSYFAVMELDGSILLHYYNKPSLSASCMKKLPLKWIVGE